MDRLCNSGKSLMASTECSASPEMIARTINEPLNYAHGAINKRVRITTPQDLQVMFHNVLKRPDMFGLRLTKTNSLIDSVHAILCEATPSDAPPAARDVSCEVGRGRESNSSSKLKATNFFASLLKIGDWKFVPRFNDLMAKCYFAKHKLVWEILQDGLKSKMEIPWSHITAIKATFSGSGGTLDIALAKPPLFFREHNPQPKKHTSWKECADFTTNGQASTNRWHHLECSNGLELKKNFEKLISCDPRLKALSQQQDFPYSNPLYPCFANQGISNSHGLHGATVTELASPASTIIDKSDACKCSDEMPNSQKLDAPSTCSGKFAIGLKPALVSNSIFNFFWFQTGTINKRWFPIFPHL
ncbi:hypothetical protein Cni_G05785 [Canna indica]|uniref:TRF2/HOY1 PH-like domain-containing protein n=1 Tax=Canna indica TaxID=4628 RepID=A0AAQ3JVT5_9LILI|nr:hypothetical protein Cni_G05785 [Canna indica]